MMSRDLEEGELRESPVITPGHPQRKKRRLENSMSPFIDTDDVSSMVDDITVFATSMLMSKKPVLTQEEGSYERIKLIGQGTFGEVYQACRLSDGLMVALKKIRMEEHNNTLKRLKHPHILGLIDMCFKDCDGKRDLYMVSQFCNHDLAGILTRLDMRKEPHVVKTLIHHLFLGLAYLHENGFIHRDFKSANILLSADGYLKVADFGLVRDTRTASNKLFTSNVVTMWYRPPEILFGSKLYTSAIDLWGAGCIIAEFWNRMPILPGKTEVHQLALISNLCGTISPKTMPGCDELPYFDNLKTGLQKGPPTLLQVMRSIIPNVYAVELVSQLLVLDPEKRLTAAEALEHRYFHSEPLPLQNVEDFVQNLKGNYFGINTAYMSDINCGLQKGERRGIGNGQLYDRIY
ncbi:hypothetical protein FO519_002641 [Halicephalobus sp. NKZ332]|nr:hypothetical protein FO519_002641 [Halicephalobus sp. NKZ332]